MIIGGIEGWNENTIWEMDDVELSKNKYWYDLKILREWVIFDKYLKMKDKKI